MENLIKMDDLRVPLFSETPISLLMLSIKNGFAETNQSIFALTPE